jgi:hypothetical protein
MVGGITHLKRTPFNMIDYVITFLVIASLLTLLTMFDSADGNPRLPDDGGKPAASKKKGDQLPSAEWSPSSLPESPTLV